ncbi:MAG: YbgF trimerization domain-containing protein, partial [Thiobacillus sp.]|nr:YbgF trimerization domain-containing protein [Thiobacillus sp.]
MMRRYGLIFACAFALAQPAWADTAELARQVQALQQLAGALDARLGKLEGAIQQNPQLLGLLNEVEMLKAEVARMRGQAEVQMHQLDTLGKRQNDLYADLDQRIADLAKAAQPAPVAAVAQPAASAPTTTPPAAAGGLSQPDPLVESRSYEAALSQFREANYAGAIAGFNGFLKAYPDSALAANAQYWIGY